MKIVILCDWLPPEFGAVGQYALAYARGLACAGHHVALIGLSTQRVDDAVEEINPGRLVVRRVVRPRYAKHSNVRRAVWTIASNFALLWRARHVLRHVDELQFSGSPPYMIHFAQPLALLPYTLALIPSSHCSAPFTLLSPQYGAKVQSALQPP